MWQCQHLELFRKSCFPQSWLINKEKSFYCSCSSLNSAEIYNFPTMHQRSKSKLAAPFRAICSLMQFHWPHLILQPPTMTLCAVPPMEAFLLSYFWWMVFVLRWDSCKEQQISVLLCYLISRFEGRTLSAQHISLVPWVNRTGKRKSLCVFPILGGSLADLSHSLIIIRMITVQKRVSVVFCNFYLPPLSFIAKR